MTDVEVIEFFVPHTSTSNLYIPEIKLAEEEGGEARDSSALKQVYDGLHQGFSQFGLIHQVKVVEKEGEPGFYAYVRFFSGRSASRARAAVQRKQLSLRGCLPIKVAKCSKPAPCGLPLSKFKCEELANYYLGFSGWRSRVLYHRREESDDLAIKFVSVVKLEFPKYGLSCEGAGLTEISAVQEGESYCSLTVQAAKRSLGEAVIAAWSKVVLVVVEGARVELEINTARTDAFFYNPLWDEPVVQVTEVEDAVVADSEEEDDNDHAAVLHEEAEHSE